MIAYADGEIRQEFNSRKDPYPRGRRALASAQVAVTVAVNSPPLTAHHGARDKKQQVNGMTG